MGNDIVGIDHSLRSTGVVSLDAKGKLKHYTVIAPPKEMKQEILLLHQLRCLEGWAAIQNTRMDFALEGLSFGAVGSSKDLQAGLFWAMRLQLMMNYPDSLVGVVPVTSWRAKVLTPEEQKKAKLSGKDGLKKATVEKLPSEVWDAFTSYLQAHEARLRLAKGSSWKECLYDLTDAYFLARYRWGLLPYYSSVN